MKRNLLLTPGPTQIPPELCAALGKPILHHRTPQFQDILKRVHEGLQFVFQTKNEVYMMPASGTGAMEAAVANLFSPGDKAIVVDGGKFGERWGDLCRVYGVEAVTIKVEWGKAVDPLEIKKLLKEHPQVKAVLTTLNETSTGVVMDIRAIGEIVKSTAAALVVDAVSGLGVVDCQMDNWSVDVICSASHKGFMLPPGLAFVAVSSKAMGLMEKSTNRRMYFDLRKYKKAWQKTDTPYTPAIGITVAMEESLKYFRDKGLENLFAHYARLAQATRAAAKALGLGLLAHESCISNVLTAMVMPEGIDGEKVVKIMRDTYGVTMAGGQDHFKGKIIRLAHMGCVDEYDILTGIACLEKALRTVGHQFEFGAGLAAAQKSFNQ